MTLLSENDFSVRMQALAQAHTKATHWIFDRAGPQMLAARLCGGTALSWFHLSHRLSFDLDFFLPTGFNSEAMLRALGAGAPVEDVEITHDASAAGRADQLHFTLVHPQEGRVKMSFVEDAYAEVFLAQPSPLMTATGPVQTEGVDGLYHRKLRTVVGWAGPNDMKPAGGRQTARDLFDLAVLSDQHMPIKDFANTLPYPFPWGAFVEGVASMPWFDLREEIEQIISAPRWANFTDVETVRLALFEQVEVIEQDDTWERDQ